jgi:hypothetical protein
MLIISFDINGIVHKKTFVVAAKRSIPHTAVATAVSTATSAVTIMTSFSRNIWFCISLLECQSTVKVFCVGVRRAAGTAYVMYVMYICIENSDGRFYIFLHAWVSCWIYLPSVHILILFAWAVNMVQNYPLIVEDSINSDTNEQFWQYLPLSSNENHVIESQRNVWFLRTLMTVG